MQWKDFLGAILSTLMRGESVGYENLYTRKELWKLIVKKSEIVIIPEFYREAVEKEFLQKTTAGTSPLPKVNK